MEGLRTGDYEDERGDFDAMRYVHQLWLWLLCVSLSQFVIVSVELPRLSKSFLSLLLRPLDYIDLQDPSMLLLCCLCRSLQRLGKQEK